MMKHLLTFGPSKYHLLTVLDIEVDLICTNDGLFIAPESLAPGENGEGRFDDPVLIDCLIQDIEVTMVNISDLGLDLPL